MAATRKQYSSKTAQETARPGRTAQATAQPKKTAQATAQPTATAQGTAPPAPVEPVAGTVSPRNPGICGGRGQSQLLAVLSPVAAVLLVLENRPPLPACPSLSSRRGLHQ